MKKIILSLLFTPIAIAVFSQNLRTEFNFSSPDVGQLVSEVQTPVSLSSGTTSVEIPLFEINNGEISVPVSLNYDASGIRVDAHPGWVGQNWSLKAGGAISRVVRSIPDETHDELYYYLRISGNNQNTIKYPWGYWYNTSKLNNSTWNSTTQIENWAKPSSSFSELEPDEFIFNFCGYTGKFYMNKDNFLVAKEDKGIRIEPVVYQNIPYYDSNLHLPDPLSFTYYDPYVIPVGNGFIDGFYKYRDSKIIGFLITLPNGFKYYFGLYEKNQTGFDYMTDGLDEVELNADFFSQFHIEKINTWYLTKIVSPTGDVTSFQYERGDPIVEFSKNYSINKMSGSAPSSFGIFKFLGIGNVSAYSFSAKQYLSGSLIRPTYLSKITTKNAEIIFTTSISQEQTYNYNFIHSKLHEFAQDTTIHILVFQSTTD